MRHLFILALLAALAVVLSTGAVSAEAKDGHSMSPSVSSSRSQISRAIALEAKQVLTSEHITKLDGKEAYDAFIGAKDKFTVVFFHATWSGRSNRFANDFATIAEQYASTNKNIQFAVLDANSHEAICRAWHITAFPTVKMITRGVTETANSFHDFYDGPEAFAKFIDRVLLHEKWRYVKRAGTEGGEGGAPSNALVHPQQGSVIELDHSNFDNFTKSTNFFTFVLFYAPWCGACKEMAGEMEATARYFKRDPRVIIGRVNADDHPTLIERYSISALPTMYMFPKARVAKRGLRYTGGRDHHDMQAIIDTQNRMADNAEMPYIDENTDMETLLAEMKLDGRDPETLMRSYAAKSGQEYKAPEKKRGD